MRAGAQIKFGLQVVQILDKLGSEGRAVASHGRDVLAKIGIDGKRGFADFEDIGLIAELDVAIAPIGHYLIRIGRRKREAQTRRLMQKRNRSIVERVVLGRLGIGDSGGDLEVAERVVVSRGNVPDGDVCFYRNHLRRQPTSRG